MHWIDWAIVVVPVSLIIFMAIYARRYAHGVADYLAAGRVAGRYVICVGNLATALSVITLVAGSERQYQTGYSVSFWNHLIAPLSVILSLTGFCIYRWRQTRSLSKGQFIELRYGSKTFRVVTAVISTLSEMMANALGPAIATNFFIYYLGLPHRIMICGINLPCYGIIVTLCLTLAIIIIWPAGRVSLLLTDCIQGLISYPIFVMIVGFILLKFSWNQDISPIFWDRAPGQSFMNPYDISQLRDFNLFALVVTLFSTVLNRASWYGNDTSNAGRNPHEQKMASILGSWRSGLSYMMTLLVAVLVYVFMNSGNFAMHNETNHFKVTNNEIRQNLSYRVIDEVVADPIKRAEVNEAVATLPPVQHVIGQDQPLSQQKNLDTRYFDVVRDKLGDSPEGRYQFQRYRTLYQQMMMPVVLKNVLPAGMLGLFCLLMIMLLISTDDSRIFNAAGCIVQDMILPFFKTRPSSKAHLLMLKLTSVGVALFFLGSMMLFSQLDYINMFTTIMTALWTGGAGTIMLFGLYSRFGNIYGAWCALIFGSGHSLLGLILQRNWAAHVYPFLERHNWVEPLNRFLITVSSPFDPWIKWSMNPVKYPINSYEIFFISMILAVSTYVIASLLTYKPYDLDKLLHRGKYSDDPEAEKKKTRLTLGGMFQKLIGISPEHTKGDRILSWSVFFYSIVYAVGIKFVIVVIWNIFYPWPRSWWDAYFFIGTLVIPGIVGVITTVWFLIGGIRDACRLLRDLAKRVDNPEDNGQVNLKIPQPSDPKPEKP